MKKRYSLGTVIVLMLIAAFISFQLTYIKMTNNYEEKVYDFNRWSEITAALDNVDIASSSDTDDTWQDVYSELAAVDSYVRSAYIGDIDEEELQDYVLTGYMYGIGDKYAAYMPRSEYDAFVMSSTGGTMVGIGVRIAYDNTLGGIYITSVMPETPAERAGVLPGDIIVAVDGNDVSENGYYNSYNLIKSGAEGESVKLSIATAVSEYAEIVDYEVVREVVNTETVIARMIDDDIAYVNILSFDSTTSEEFKTKMEELKTSGAQRYIFDVRNNPGGTIEGVAGVLDYLLPEGPIIRCYAKSGEVNVYNSDAKELSAPMVVIANENTASGGELFTAALRDYEKATVIGTTTYGKGTVQSVIELPDGSGFKFSTMMYNPPFGDNYEGVGIEPDKTVELSAEASANFYKLTDEEDAQLMAALDEIRPR